MWGHGSFYLPMGRVFSPLWRLCSEMGNSPSDWLRRLACKTERIEWQQWRRISLIRPCMALQSPNIFVIIIYSPCSYSECLVFQLARLLKVGWVHWLRRSGTDHHSIPWRLNGGQNAIGAGQIVAVQQGGMLYIAMHWSCCLVDRWSVLAIKDTLCWVWLGGTVAAKQHFRDLNRTVHHGNTFCSIPFVVKEAMYGRIWETCICICIDTVYIFMCTHTVHNQMTMEIGWGM